MSRKTIIANLDQRSVRGFMYALLTYSFWGLVPLYWKLLVAVPALQLVSQRILWSLVFLSFFFVSPVKAKALAGTFRDRRKVGWLLLSSICIGANWLIFVIAIQQKMLLQASLGYFINPLVNVALGRIFLGERLNINQLIAFGIAALGVICLTVSLGQLPLVD